MAEPLRRCVGCGKSISVSRLMRFSAKNQELVQAIPGFGRGAWICRTPDLACFDLATERKQWSRALRSRLTGESVALMRLQSHESF